jgi:hypothetical protein
VPVHRFSCGLDGHLCTFPCGDDFWFKVINFFGRIFPFIPLHLIFLLRSCFCAEFGELTNYNWALTDQSSPDRCYLGSWIFKQLHVRVDIADYYVKVSACWLNFFVPSSERVFAFN